MQTGWNPNFSRPVLYGIPVKAPTEEQVNRFYMLFYSMIGGFASMVQTQITDTYNLIKENKKIFRFEAKKKNNRGKGLLRRPHRCLYALYEGMRYVSALDGYD